MEEYKTLNVLENRIKKLESLVSKVSLEDVNISKIKPVLSTLHEVDTVLLSTLSGRDKISALVKKVNVLEEIFDPSFLQTHFNLDSKLETVLASEADLLYLNQELQRIEELDHVLDKDNIEKLSSASDRLSKLTTNVLHVKEECDKQTEEVKTLVTDYKQSLTDLSNLFVELEILVSQLEKESSKNK